MNTESTRRIADAIARSSLTPFVAVVVALFVFRLDPGPVSGGWRYTLRAIPHNSLVQTFVLIWFYRGYVDVRGLFTRNWHRGIIEGVALVPLFEAAFLVITILYGRILEVVLASRPFGLDAPQILTACNIAWLRSTPLTLHDPLILDIAHLFTEELLCRGLFLNLILTRTGDARKAVLGSALFFALFHGQMLMVPWYFLWGCAVGAAYLRTRSLWTPLVIHAANNLTSMYWPSIVAFVRGHGAS